MLSEARRGETPAAPGRYARSVDGGEYLSRRLLRREADARYAHPSLQRTSGAPFIGTTDPRHVRLPHRAFTHVTRVTSSSSRLEFIQFTSHCLLFLINIFPHYTPSHACIQHQKVQKTTAPPLDPSAERETTQRKTASVFPASMSAPVFKLVPGCQSYDWGKRGQASLAAQLASRSVPGFKVDDSKPYAEVSDGASSSWRLAVLVALAESVSSGWARTPLSRPSSKTARCALNTSSPTPI